MLREGTTFTRIVDCWRLASYFFLFWQRCNKFPLNSFCEQFLASAPRSSSVPSDYLQNKCYTIFHVIQWISDLEPKGRCWAHQCLTLIWSTEQGSRFTQNVMLSKHTIVLDGVPCLHLSPNEAELQHVMTLWCCVNRSEMTLACR